MPDLSQSRGYGKKSWLKEKRSGSLGDTVGYTCLILSQSIKVSCKSNGVMVVSRFAWSVSIASAPNAWTNLLERWKYASGCLCYSLMNRQQKQKQKIRPLQLTSIKQNKRGERDINSTQKDIIYWFSNFSFSASRLKSRTIMQSVIRK